jgi:GNAT superfamily N-acetyltransferase
LDFAQGTDLEEAVRRYIDHSLSDDLSDIPFNYRNRSGDNFWVAEQAGQVRGMVGIQKRSEAEAELRRMSVARDARRQGIGGKLLETVEDFCREQGYSQIFLTTVSQLVPAISMYRKYGFQLTGLEAYGVMSVHRYIKHL